MRLPTIGGASVGISACSRLARASRRRARIARLRASGPAPAHRHPGPFVGDPRPCRRASSRRLESAHRARGGTPPAVRRPAEGQCRDPRTAVQRGVSPPRGIHGLQTAPDEKATVCALAAINATQDENFAPFVPHNLICRPVPGWGNIEHWLHSVVSSDLYGCRHASVSLSHWERVRGPRGWRCGSKPLRRHCVGAGSAATFTPPALSRGEREL